MKMQEVPGSEFEMPADLVLLAMGFVSPVHQGLLDEFGVEKDARGNVQGHHRRQPARYQTSLPKVFAAGDMRRGQSLVVWAIREGRQCARAVDEFLMGSSELAALSVLRLTSQRRGTDAYTRALGRGVVAPSACLRWSQHTAGLR